MNLKILFFPATIIATIILVIWFIFPQWEIIQEKKMELDEKMETVFSLEEKKVKVNKNIEVYESNIRDAELIYNALPSEINNDSFVDELFEGAKNNEVLITNINIGNIKPAKTANSNKNKMTIVNGDILLNGEKKEEFVPSEILEIPFSLDMIGNYIEMRNFISFMESAHRLFIIEDISMKQEGEGSNAVNVSISGTSFYKKDNSNLTVSSVIYTNEPILKSLMNVGLKVDSIDNYKNRVVNTDYVFNPVATGIGKEDLFSTQNKGGVVEESMAISEAEIIANTDSEDLIVE